MYVAELRSLVVYCNFEGTLEKILRDRLVGGINDSRIRKRLLQEKDLTFKKALEIAQALEVAERDEWKLVENTTEPVQKLQDSKLRATSRSTRKEDTPTYSKCYRCGKSNHRASNCRFKSAKCHNCGKTSHLKAVCQQPVKKDRRDAVKQISEDEREADRDGNLPDEYTHCTL